MWFLYALIASVCQATVRIANQHFKYDGISLTIVIKSFLTLLTIPFLFFVPWPQNPWFYVLTLATAPLVVYQDKAFFDFSSKFGAGPVSRVEPLSVPFVFITWLLLNPSLLLERVQQPLIFGGICLCILISTLFALRMKACPVNGKALTAMVPLIFVSGTINLLAKAGVDYTPELLGITVYIFLQSFFVVLISLAWNKRTGQSTRQSLSKPRLVKTAIIMAVIILILIILRLLAFKLTENPAYVTAVMLTGPFWTLLINAAMGHKEQGDIRNGLGIVVSVLTLTLLTSL